MLLQMKPPMLILYTVQKDTQMHTHSNNAIVYIHLWLPITDACACPSTPSCHRRHKGDDTQTHILGQFLCKLFLAYFNAPVNSNMLWLLIYSEPAFISFYNLTKQRQHRWSWNKGAAQQRGQDHHHSSNSYIKSCHGSKLGVINIPLNEGKGTSGYPVHSHMQIHTHTFREPNTVPFLRAKVRFGWQRHLIYIPPQFPWQFVWVFVGWL